MDVIQSFFSEIGTPATDKEYQNLIFILVNEFHWTQEDIEKSDMPFVIELLNTRKRIMDEQERQSKRRR